MNSRSDDAVAQAFGTLFAFYFLVLIWLGIKLFELVARVLIRHPDCRPVWLAVVLVGVCAVADFASAGQVEILNYLSAASVVVLAITAKVAEMYYDTYLQPSLSRELLIDQVLSKPWFQLES